MGRCFQLICGDIVSLTGLIVPTWLLGFPFLLVVGSLGYNFIDLAARLAMGVLTCWNHFGSSPFGDNDNVSRMNK